MSSLWTPDGERPIRRAQPDPEPRVAEGPEREPTEAELAAEDSALAEEMKHLQDELVAAPVEAVIANHAVGLFNLAGLHLSQDPPHLDEARLAIDALAALLEGLTGRLGPDETTLRDGLAQMRMAFVQISAAHREGPATGT
ncbi:MAG: DUF1844 domain-containing protein [Acidimicrobiaceae bacterium]|nr:DUF1844 domain-containing protein [Acidimicrobiaceae bacterium]